MSISEITIKDYGELTRDELYEIFKLRVSDIYIYDCRPHIKTELKL